MKNIRTRTLIVAILVAFTFMMPGSVSAHSGHELQEQAEQKKAEMQQKATQYKAVAKQRLDEAKQKACVRYEKNIIAMMNRVTDRRHAQIDHITDIANKTKAFYVKKGYILSNYNDLVDAVAAKKTEAEAAIAATKATADFRCDSDGPKAQLQTFRDARSKAIDAIQTYKQSVKTLIQGVKSAQSQGVQS